MSTAYVVARVEVIDGRRTITGYLDETHWRRAQTIEWVPPWEHALGAGPRKYAADGVMPEGLWVGSLAEADGLVDELIRRGAVAAEGVRVIAVIA